MGMTPCRTGLPDVRGRVPAIAAALIWLVWSLPAVAQQGTITGQVTDAETLEPLSQTAVSVVDSETGTLTDAEGRYRLEVPAGEVELRVVRIGYRTVTRSVTVTAGQTATLDFTLETSAISLDEIAVTGTPGGQVMRSLGNTVSEIDAEAVAERGTPDVSNLLQAQAPGVNVASSTGQVGSGPNTRIRGVSTFSLDDHPLVYVDGIRVDNASGKGVGVQGGGLAVQSSINDLNPQDIESIEVIKGPAAATLYGTEASNGVVQILTKQGSASDQPTINLTLSQGANWFRNADGLIDPSWGIHPETGEPFALDLFESEAARGNDIFQTGHNQSYALSVRGGSDDVRYYVGANVDEQEGVEAINFMDRIGTRANFSVTPDEDWRFDASVGYVQTDRSFACNNGCGTMFSTVFAAPSTIDTPYRGFRLGPPEFTWNWRTIEQDTEKFTYSLTTEWETTDWLSQRLVVGQDNVGDKGEQLVERMVDPYLLQFVTEETARGSKFLERRDHTTTTFDYSGTVDVPLTESWESTTSVGVQYYGSRTEFVTVDARGFPAPGVTVTAGAAQTDVGQDNFVENNTLGSYLQQRFSWNGRLYLTGAVRVDDNSAFGSDFDLVAYPKASASWVVSEEDFFDVEWINQLRVRGAFGQAGQQPQTFAALRTFQPVTSGTGETALTPQSVGNQDLAPERGSEIEAGFDASLLDERLGVDFTFYHSTTNDAILQRQVPPSAGFSGSQFVNAGEIRSLGVEVGIDGRALDSEDLTLDLGLNLSTVDNEVVDLGGIDQGTGFISSVESIRFVPGFPVASYFDEETVSAELDSDGKAVNVMCDSGDPNGPTLPDGTPLTAGGPPVACEEAPDVFQGKSTPDFEGALTVGLTLYGNLRLHGLVDWQVGFRKFDNTIRYKCQALRLCEENFFPERFDPVRVAEMQSPNTLRTFIYNDASFAKIRQLSASYDFPSSLLRSLNIGVEAATLTVSGRNLFPTLTDWPSMDPESQYHDQGVFGFSRLEEGQMPPPANVTASLRLTL